jgi:hypothetical protein
MSSSATAMGANGCAAPLIERLAAWLATRVAWWSVLAGTCAVLLVPLFLVDVPPLLDYPNHLARMYVLAFGAHDPILSHMYAQHWAIIPNLAIDLVLPEMLKILPIYVAGRVVLAATLLLPLAGVIVYHRVAFGVRSYWPIAAALTAYNALFILGFMNFLLSLGMALLVAAGWLRWRERHLVTVALCGAVATTAIFFMHLFGLLFLAVLLGTEELAWFWWHRSDRPALLPRLMRHSAIGLAAFLPPVMLYALAPLSDAGGRVIWLAWHFKLVWLAEPFMTYDGAVDLLVTLAFLGLLYGLWRVGRLRAAVGLGGALLVLLAMYVACPFVMMGTGFIDARFPVMIGLLMFAGLRPVRLPPRVRAVIAVVLALTFLARTASLATVWHAHNQDLTDMRRVIAPVPRGARVLVVTVDPQDNPDYWNALPRGREIPELFRIEFHLPALLVIEHQAFFPCLFTVRAKQPLITLPPYDRLGAPECQPPDWQSLVVGYSVHPVTPAPYLRNWQRNYDFVLLLNAGGAGDLRRFLPERLTLLTSADVAALYRVRPPAPVP